MTTLPLFDLESVGPDTYVGYGPQYPWGGLYGGQIVAQALRAASYTVDPALHVHSLRAYFIRRGDHTQSIRFEVDRIRDGRSFAPKVGPPQCIQRPLGARGILLFFPRL